MKKSNSTIVFNILYCFPSSLSCSVFIINSYSYSYYNFVQFININNNNSSEVCVIVYYYCLINNNNCLDSDLDNFSIIRNSVKSVIIVSQSPQLEFQFNRLLSEVIILDKIQGKMGFYLILLISFLLSFVDLYLDYYILS